ncbi:MULTISPECIES: hypothetical protein [Bacillus]|uniref:hypothetical protein n=1 Tax=Bacillus TaxID=1386 RepID=UPI00030A2321|nr:MULTISPECIES: hypothetical protein [Bacillus]
MKIKVVLMSLMLVTVLSACFNDKIVTQLLLEGKNEYWKVVAQIDNPQSLEPSVNYDIEFIGKEKDKPITFTYNIENGPIFSDDGEGDLEHQNDSISQTCSNCGEISTRLKIPVSINWDNKEEEITLVVVNKK